MRTETVDVPEADDAVWETAEPQRILGERLEMRVRTALATAAARPSPLLSSLLGEPRPADAA